MPDTSNTTSPAASAKTTRPAATSLGGRSLETLKTVSDVVSESKADGVAKGVKDDIDKYLAGVLTKPARPEPDNVCTNPKPKIAAFCSARKLAHQQADLTFEGSKEDATAPFRSALAAWRMALNQYDLSIAQAQADFDQAVAAAVATYEDEINDDSRSREWYLYYTMKLAVVDALQAFQGSTTSADATLAGAAGTLIAAYPAYADAIATAQCQRLVDEATAGQTFWQSVENVLDSTS